MHFLRPLALAAALATLTGLPVRAAAPAGSPIVIGAILSITGNYAPLGEPERNALVIAQKDINAHGGIAGRPVQITILDDEGKADVAQQLATQLTGQHVAAIVGGTLTPTTAAISRVTNAAKTVEIYMNPSDMLWNTKAGVMKYLYETTPRNALEADKLITFLRDKKHAKRMAIMHDEAPYGVSGSAVVRAEAERLGMPVVDDESFPITATDVTPQLQKALAAKADALMIWTASPVAPLLVRQAKQFGFAGTIAGTTGIVSDNFVLVAGKDGYGVYSDMNLNLVHPSPEQARFLAQYRAAYHTKPSNFASFAWDAAHLIARAIDGTKGNTDGDALTGWLQTMKPYDGTTGRFQFTAADHNGLGPDAVKMAVENGTFNVIE
jgi:branched-chain amino acid transport system substrate-binding protein